MIRESTGHDLDESEPLSGMDQHITSFGEHALAGSLWNPPAPGRKREGTYFPNNFSNDRSNSVKLFQVCYAGGYYDHKENGNIKTCPFAQCPDKLHSLSPVSLQCINSRTCQSDIRAADKHLGLVCCGWKGKYFSFFPIKYFSKRRKRKEKMTVIG